MKIVSSYHSLKTFTNLTDEICFSADLEALLIRLTGPREKPKYALFIYAGPFE